MPLPYAFLCGVTQIAQMTQIFEFSRKSSARRPGGFEIRRKKGSTY